MSKSKRFLEDMREGLQQSIEYFATSNKPERERWVCHEFLRNLNFRPWKKSFVSVAEDPPDVMYRTARFEVKEILDPGRKRHNEFRDALDRALKAKHPSDLLEQYSPRDLMPEQVGELIVGKLTALRTKYSATTKASIDLLFYVNLIHTHPKPGLMPSTSAFSTFGWRSVSALFGHYALVFFANYKSPRFLRNYAGKMSVKRLD